MIHHLCLVSHQVTPNLTPLIDPRTRPDTVVLAVSDAMRERADSLERVIRPRGIRVVRWPVDNPYDIERTRDQLLDQISEYPEHDQLVLNATGGAKPMSIAAYEIFRELDRPIFYVHPEKDRLIWMHPMGQASIDLADRLKLEDFLDSHGASVQGEIQRSRTPPEHHELVQRLIVEIDRFAVGLSTLNWLANSAQGNLRSSPLSEVGNSDRDLELLIDEFSRSGRFKVQNGCLQFASEEDRFYVNGGWLEHYVYDTAANLHSERMPQDLGRAINLQRRQRGKTIPNEIDVAALVDNRLHLIECKARKWQRAPAEGGPGADALYRLDTLTDLLGGLNARAMLISYQPLPDHVRQRAADLRIEVSAGRDLQRLRERLRRWFWP